MYDCAQTSLMPNGSAVTTYTASATLAATAPSRTPVRTSGFESSTTRPAMTTAGTDSALIDTAGPAASQLR